MPYHPAIHNHDHYYHGYYDSSGGGDMIPLSPTSLDFGDGGGGMVINNKATRQLLYANVDVTLKDLGYVVVVVVVLVVAIK